MCGFAGALNLDGRPVTPEDGQRAPQAMGAQMARRGPDDEQFFDDGSLSLVFRRLSIIDLAGGQQPIWNEDHTVMAVVNGEIYNHRELRSQLEARHTFRSRSDSEVVLHLYEEHGDAFVERLNGMFAIALWDTTEHRLLLYRDRLGIKPLFFAEANGHLLFASELKALLVHPLCPRTLDWHAFGAEDRWHPSVPTYVDGVACLPGGHWMKVERGVVATARAYWTIDDHLAPADADEAPEDVHDRYGELLEESVKMRLMSDVPVGIFLSGGIDSSLITGIAARAKQDLHCFTVAEDTTVEVGDAEQAHLIAQRLDLPFHALRLDWRSLANELDYDLTQFEYLVWLAEKPQYSIEWFMKHELHRFAKTQVPDLKVMLLGQGADEFAGGYSRSIGREISWNEYLHKIATRDRRRLGSELGIPPPFVGLLADRLFEAHEVRDTYQEEMWRRINRLQHYNLWHEDRTSSGQGIESRVPFLDHRIVELLASVPPRHHRELFENKHIVRHQLSRVMPEYPPEKLKVRFFATGNEVSIHRIMRRMLLRLYPQFREKYLACQEPLFSDARFSALVAHCLRAEMPPARELRVIFNAMATAAFHRMLTELAAEGPPPAIDPPSPLRAATESEIYAKTG